jgi:hypothetical protein
LVVGPRPPVLRVKATGTAGEAAAALTVDLVSKNAKEFRVLLHKQGTAD